MPDQPQQIQIQAEWAEVESPIYFSNAFACQPIKDEFVVTFGTLTPPIRQLTADDVRNLKISIKPVVRIGMTPGRMLELINLLQGQLKAYSDTLEKDPN